MHKGKVRYDNAGVESVCKTGYIYDIIDTLRPLTIGLFFIIQIKMSFFSCCVFCKRFGWLRENETCAKKKTRKGCEMGPIESSRS